MFSTALTHVHARESRPLVRLNSSPRMRISPLVPSLPASTPATLPSDWHPCILFPHYICSPLTKVSMPLLKCHPTEFCPYPPILNGDLSHSTRAPDLFSLFFVAFSTFSIICLSFSFGYLSSPFAPQNVNASEQPFWFYSLSSHDYI